MKTNGIIIITALCASLLFVAGCSSTLKLQSHSPNSKATLAQLSTKDPASLTDREKWSLSRRAFDLAESSRKKGDSESAVYFYETALDLLGSLDLASVELNTQRVLTFNRKVLQSYDSFLESIPRLPASAGATAVLEAGVLEDNDDEPEELEPLETQAEAEVDSPAVMVYSQNPLPGVPMYFNPQVQSSISFLQKKGRSVMMRWMERSAEVFPRLRPILREEGIPEEVMYLSMIESGLNMQAYSYAKASGLWQFIPGTARIYGLHVDRVYDERRHVELSTRAACSYLRKLYNQFGDWYLAFASYNCGEGRVEREVNRSHTSDYWKLKKLPKQTRNYVPMYLATRAICENPERYGFPSMPKEKPYECERVYVDGAYSLEHIARAAGADVAEVKYMNPEFLRGVLPASDRPFQVRLPVKAQDDFDTRLASMPETPVMPTTVHYVKKGETLGSIASKYGTSVSAIRGLVENKKVKPNSLRIGQEVVIPVPSTGYASTKVKSAPVETQSDVVMQEPEMTEDRIVYTVHRGESLGRIATQLGVSVDQICAENNIHDRNEIHPGQKLKITVKGTPQYAAKKASNVSKYHTVQDGDTVWSIAQSYGVESKEIIGWNRLTRAGRIYPGQKLIVSK